MTDEEKEICKLVTKDEVMHWMKNHFELSHYYHPYSKLENYSIPYTEIESMVKRMPTVEAIPITLIEDWRKERVNELIKELVRICKEFESKLLEAEKKILETWEKEHEENNL